MTAGMRTGITMARVLFVSVTVPVLLAQSVLSQLGLTEAAARNFLVNEIKSPAKQRNSPIVQAGNQAFLKLPPAARGPAATALFGWAKAYVDSAAFKTEYTRERRNKIPAAAAEPPVEEEVRKKIQEALATIEQTKKNVSFLPAADRATVLEAIKEQEAQWRSPEMFNTLKSAMESERADRSANEAAQIKSVDEQFPADPRKLFARRLHEFLNETADLNFSAKTISLTGGPDGIEFVDPADRKHSWLWEESVIVGKEAVLAARAAAEAWLKELER